MIGKTGRKTVENPFLILNSVNINQCLHVKHISAQIKQEELRRVKKFSEYLNLKVQLNGVKRSNGFSITGMGGDIKTFKFGKDWV